MKLLRTDGFPILLGLIILIVIGNKLLKGAGRHNTISVIPETKSVKKQWRPPDILDLPATPEADLIRYGRDLIANTSKYLGPRGIVTHVGNGLNCQNCHIDAGARPFGNSMADVAITYPIYRPRSGIIESIEFRVNDCMLRSMNGKAIDSTGKEMRAIVAYLLWLGKDMPKEMEKDPGQGLDYVPLLERAADPVKGEVVYMSKCRSCHGAHGEGIPKPDSTGYIYPPLWGNDSYNTGAGLYRLTRFAGFVKSTMPFGATHDIPQLTNEEAWDVGAFVNSQPRPEFFFKGDWPDIRKKAIDHPYGPYADGFSERQHKYGPYKPIIQARDANKKNN